MNTLITILIAGMLSNIVPMPSKIVEGKGTYIVADGVYSPLHSDAETYDIVSYFGITLNLPVNKVPYPVSGIIFKYDKKLSKEAYRIEVTRSKVTVYASEYRGFLHAYHTLLQMLPNAAFCGRRDSGEKWEIPCCVIEDTPRFEYRALMLDVSGHHFAVGEIKRVVHAMAIYKMNVLHLNLGGSALLNGVYSKEDIAEIIRYAWRYGVDVMPGIDYTSIVEPTGEEISGKEIKFFEEAAGMFPFKFFHIGGGECEPGYRNDCVAAPQKSAALIKKLWNKGKSTVGWSGIYNEEDMHPNAVLMEWNDKEICSKAAAKGLRVVYADRSELFFNSIQSEDVISEPAGNISTEVVSLEKVYSVDPTMGLTGEALKNVIGVEGCIWTEKIDQNWLLEYMMLPRLLALSELGWCEPSVRDFDRFSAALRERQFRILETLDYAFRSK